MERGARRVTDSQVESLHLVRMSHLNSAGRLFGGQLMQWIDEAAAMVGKRHAHRPIVTASIDNLQFLRGAYPGDTVVLKAKLVYVGHTSMDIKVETYTETVWGEQLLINCAYATEVAVGEDGKPTMVPELIVETEEEQEEWNRSVLRRELRKKHS